MLCPGRVGREPCTHPGSARYQRIGVGLVVREGQAETTTRELLRVLAYPKFRAAACRSREIAGGSTALVRELGVCHPQ